ncbi:hypothetical protein, partial [Sphingobacterium thalpophilum]|uniref:hypothetical protein n=1 Tax=Sphingobacterium thalpophilum TaxID=259 RepID=UPI003C750EFD
SRWYCRNRWESRSVPFFTRKPLLETVKGFFRFEPLMFLRWMTNKMDLTYICLSGETTDLEME